MKMIHSLIWFSLVFQVCLAMLQFSAVDYRTHQKRLKNVLEQVAKKDPCSVGMWLHMTGEEVKDAETQCKQAYGAFVGLRPVEKEGCNNAKLLGCHPLPDCGLLFGCTFECTTIDVTWSTNPLTQKEEQVITPKQERKHIKVIVNEISQMAEDRKQRWNRHDAGSSSRGRKRKTTD